MKLTIIALSHLAIFSSCKPQIPLVNNSQPVKMLHEETWFFNFKNEVFVRCLKELYPQSFTTFIDSSDASSSANVERLDHNPEVIKLVDSVVYKFIKRQETSWTIESKKVILNVCLSYRNSTELDSLAVLFYKKHHIE